MTPANQPTPLCDEEFDGYGHNVAKFMPGFGEPPSTPYVRMAFAQALERSLAQARAECERLRAQLNRLVISHDDLAGVRDERDNERNERYIIGTQLAEARAELERARGLLQEVEDETQECAMREGVGESIAVKIRDWLGRNSPQ
jgi:hypothetical protein